MHCQEKSWCPLAFVYTETGEIDWLQPWSEFRSGPNGNKESLLEHLLLHINYIVHQCARCPSTFVTRIKYVRHCNDVHMVDIKKEEELQLQKEQQQLLQQQQLQLLQEPRLQEPQQQPQLLQEEQPPEQELPQELLDLLGLNPDDFRE